MIRILYSIVLFIVSAIAGALYGQTVSGTVSDPSGKTKDALVVLYNGDSDTLSKSTFSDESGNFIFTPVAAGNYYVQVEDNGKPLYKTDAFSVSADVALPEIRLPENAKQLQEVTVISARPYIERQPGKTILNVESSINAAGESAFGVLEKAPGVNIDSNDNINLRGRGGVMVQIDGKPTQMTGSNLANYLRGLPSNVIEKIELITNPNSKYDASGSSIINIKMKKDRRFGTNGTITTAYGQGRYPKSNSSLSLNHRNKKISAYGAYSFAYREWFNELLLMRRFYEDGTFVQAYDQDNFLKMNFRNHIGRAGFDWFVSKKHTLGVTVSAVSNKFNPTGKNDSDVLDANYDKVSSFGTYNRSRDNWHNHGLNLNHKFIIDSTGTELVTDVDYGNFGNTTVQDFTTRYYDVSGSEFQDPYLLHGDVKGNLDLFAAKSDFTTIIDGVKLETGVKSSFVKADNNLAFYDVSSGTPVFDPTKSNHFIYKENINAVYGNASKSYGKWSLSLGLRMENTNITGHQLVGDTRFRNDYTQLFPTAIVSYAFNDNHALELNYGRRITRPGYDQLNPFKFFLDPSTYKEGNPFLLPQTTHSLDLTHTWKQKFFTTLSFSRTTDNITEVIAPVPGDEAVTVQTDKNLNSADIYGLFLTIPLDIATWWTSQNSVNFYYGTYSGTVSATTLDKAGSFNFNVNSSNTFKFEKGWTGELTANYRGRELYAFMDVNPQWFLNLGIQKKYPKSTVKLAFNDIWFTNRTIADTEFTDYKERFDVRRDSRTVVLSYTYNFGSGNGAPRRRAGAADDIRQRAGSANG